MSNEVMKIEFNKDQIALIKSQIAPKATDAELQLFLYQAKRTGLDPLTRQIYAIHRKSGNEEKMTIQTSIDGFRVIAERSGDYAGQDEPIFEESNGKLIKATIKVYRFRGDQRYCAAVGVAYWDEYVVMVDEWVNKQRTGKKIPSGLWAKMPHTMLAKVAEALALRKSYPQDLSGLYTSEEMTQADAPQKTEDVKEDAYSIVTETSDINKEDPKPEPIPGHWYAKLEKCLTPEEVDSLVTAHKETVNANPELRKLFVQRKHNLKQSKTNPLPF